MGFAKLYISKIVLQLEKQSAMFLKIHESFQVKASELTTQCINYCNLKLLIILCLFACRQNCQCIIYIYTLWFIIYWIRDKKISEAEAFILFHIPASRCNLSDGKKQKIKPQGSILRA